MLSFPTQTHLQAHWTDTHLHHGSWPCKLCRVSIQDPQEKPHPRPRPLITALKLPPLVQLSSPPPLRVLSPSFATAALATSLTAHSYATWPSSPPSYGLGSILIAVLDRQYCSSIHKNFQTCANGCVPKSRLEKLFRLVSFVALACVLQLGCCVNHSYFGNLTLGCFFLMVNNS